MEIDYKTLEEEILLELEGNNKCVLSTSCDDCVTSRTISIVNIGLDIYFQTNKCYEKYFQMKKNNKVSLCFQNISIEGEAEEIGDWGDEKNEKIRDTYKEVHKNSFDSYGSLNNQVVFKIRVKKVKLWKYEKNDAYREVLDIENKVAKRLAFM